MVELHFFSSHFASTFNQILTLMDLTSYICTACGVQYEPSAIPPAQCRICSDDRQFIPASGQQWTTLQKVNKQYRNIIEKIDHHIYAIYSTPHFGIGQRAHLILSSSGNILWDCIANIDDSTTDILKSMGGIKAIALSHPHYFSTIAEWSKRFNNVPVYVQAMDAQWLGRKPENLHLWNDQEHFLWDDIKLVKCGGHFPGASVLFEPSGNGSLFVGDTIQVAPGEKTVSFMYSYPNMIPLSKKDIMDISSSVEDLQYDVMYGAFGRYIRSGAKAAMHQSVERYLQIFHT